MMATRARGPAYAGISLQPGRLSAVVVQDNRVVAIPAITALPGGTDGSASMLARIDALAPGEVSAVTLDVSHLLLDAVLHRATELPPVAVIRIVPVAATDPALGRSPSKMVERLITRRFTVGGGNDLLGNELSRLDRAALPAVCAELKTTGIVDVAIVASGSQARPLHERAVADAVQAVVPQARISLASDFGGHGLVAREATVTLDCALRPLTDVLLTEWEAALAHSLPAASLRVARGDGGYSTSSRVRSLPVMSIGSADAMQVAGAAHLERSRDCRVLLPRPGGQVAGDVRNGMVAIRSGELAAFGVQLVVPTAVLTPDHGGAPGTEPGRSTDVQVVVADRDADELTCLGAAISSPTAWLDEFAFIESAVELDRVRAEARERARALVLANGAAPGSAYVAEVSTVAVPYSPPGTVRVRVRVAGAPDTDPRRIEVFDRMAP